MRSEGRNVELAAVLWDMDGTLIDSEPYWQQEEQRLMHDAGLGWSEAEAHKYLGRSVRETARGMRGAGLKVPLDDLVDLIVTSVSQRVREELPWTPGARRLLSRMTPLRAALVTMSHRIVAQPVLDNAPVPFDAVVTGDAVERGKPDPEPYLTAAALLGVAPAACIAIEDSLPGVASAVAAGVVTIGIERQVSLSGSGAHEVVRSLEEVGIEDLERIHAKHAMSVPTRW